MLKIRSTALPALALILAAALAGCGGDSEEPSGATESPTDHSSMDMSESAEPSVDATASAESSEPAEPPAPKNLIDITIKGGKITPKPGVVSMPLGEKVTIQVTSDVAEELHLHGYDESVELVPGETGKVTFTADIPGVFEAELEESGDLLFELKVQ